MRFQSNKEYCQSLKRKLLICFYYIILMINGLNCKIRFFKKIIINWWIKNNIESCFEHIFFSFLYINRIFSILTHHQTKQIFSIEVQDSYFFKMMFEKTYWEIVLKWKSVGLKEIFIWMSNISSNNQEVFSEGLDSFFGIC